MQVLVSKPLAAAAAAAAAAALHQCKFIQKLSFFHREMNSEFVPICLVDAFSFDSSLHFVSSFILLDFLMASVWQCLMGTAGKVRGAKCVVGNVE